MKNHSLCVLVLSEDGAILEANPTFFETTGVSQEKALNQPFFEFIHEKEKPVAHSLIETLKTLEPTPAGKRLDCRVRDISGKSQWIKFDVFWDPELKNYLLFGLNTTPERMTQLTLEGILLRVCETKGEAYFKTLTQAICQFWGTDVAMVGAYVGKTIRLRAIYSGGQHVDSFSYSAQSSPCSKVIGTGSALESGDLRSRFPNMPDFLQNPETPLTHYAGCLLKDAKGTPVGLIATLSSRAPKNQIDHVKLLKLLSGQAAAELLREHSEKNLSDQRVGIATASRLSAVGELAGTIAHEINTPLSLITGKAEFLEKLVAQGKAEPSKVLETSAKIKSTALQIGKIVEGLRSISRNSENDPFKPIALYELVKQTTEFCGHKLRKNGVRLTVEPIPRDLTIECRAIEIQQILVNLINNAVDAIEKLEEKWINLEFHRHGDTAQISLTDSGFGIPKSVQEKMFEPYFSTKEPGRGTGLGLSISRRLVEQHHGQLYIDNDYPNTKFVIVLPMKQAATAGKEAA